MKLHACIISSIERSICITYKELKKLGLYRDSNGLLEIKNIDYLIDNLKNNPNQYSNEIKKLIIENFFENINFVCKKIEIEYYFNNLGITRNLSLESNTTIDKLYNLLIDIIQKCDFLKIYDLLFVNHRYFEEKRKTNNEITNINEIIQDNFFWYCDKAQDLLNNFNYN